MKRKVLLAFDDPGGGLAVSSLIERLGKEKNLKVTLFAGKLSEGFLEDTKTGFNKINSIISNSEAENMIENVLPDILVTGTSGGNAEQELRNAACRRNIMSVVVLDFWKDYSRRWKYASYEISSMKDKVCVMDKLTKEEMIKEKFPAQNLIVTGHPYLDKIFNYNEAISDILPDKNRFLFLSQPFDTLGIMNYTTHPFRKVLNALRKFAATKNEKIFLTVKLHPNEELTPELNDLVNQFNHENFEIKISAEKNKLPLLLAKSETVIGYNSIAMFEARALNRKTISLNVVPVKESLSFAMRAAGIEIMKDDEEDIFKCLITNQRYVKGPETFRGGIENCTRVIINELNLN